MRYRKERSTRLSFIVGGGTTALDWNRSHNGQKTTSKNFISRESAQRIVIKIKMCQCAGGSARKTMPICVKKLIPRGGQRSHPPSDAPALGAGARYKLASHCRI
ncbi:hypothetical protein ACJJTC_009723 [Scirpophaga incertulas]